MVLSNIFTATPINRKEISQEFLDIENKQRTNPLLMAPFFALVEQLLPILDLNPYVRNFRSDSWMGKSLMQANRRIIKPLSANSQFSLP